MILLSKFYLNNWVILYYNISINTNIYIYIRSIVELIGNYLSLFSTEYKYYRIYTVIIDIDSPVEDPGCLHLNYYQELDVIYL